MMSLSSEDVSTSFTSQRALGSEQTLVKLKECQVDFVNIEVSLLDEVFYDDIELAAVGKGKASTTDKIPCFIQVQFQSDSKGQRSRFRGLIVLVVADL